MSAPGAGRLAPEVAPGIHLLPVVHDRLELAAAVHAACDALQPAAVAVELPTTLAAAAERAVARLPRITLVVSQESDEAALAWVVAPGDPLVEALRWAQQADRPRHYVDPDVPYRERHHDAVPDPYAAWELGVAAYLELVTQATAGPGTADRTREVGMAHHLVTLHRRLNGAPLLAVVGAAHARRLARRLRQPTAEPLARRRRSSVELFHLHPQSLTAVLPDPPLAHAAWELLRGGEIPAEGSLDAAVPRRLTLQRGGFTVLSRETGGGKAGHCRRLVAYAARTTARSMEGVWVPDRHRLGEVVWEAASRSYLEQTHTAVTPWQRRLFFDFARRYSRSQGLLVPGLYEWVVAARGVGDDNLAWEILETARAYPWQEESAELPTARVDGDVLDLGTRQVRFRRRFFRVKRRPVRLPVEERPADDPADWLAAFDGSGLCSYPPEDLVVEDFGRFLQRKALSLLSAERKRSEPFSGSLLDGIDRRETVRHLATGEIWVEEHRRAPGKAGSVVVVFDRDLGTPAAFPYLMTWLGEHDQESDMAFYSTDPAAQVVGPGILRATYGGFLLTTPPGRLFDVWRDADYRHAREKAEVLLMAAIDYSREKLVVYAAAEPPSELMRRYAAQQGKRIVYVPLGSLSPATRNKIRVVHILAGRDKRRLARSYVW